jgi:membrane-associated phospholipid phosphatase
MTDDRRASAYSRKLPDTAVGRIARLVSWIGHPLVFVSASVAAIVWFRLANRVGVSALGALILAVVLPIAVLLFRGVRSGRWSDADVSVHSERVRFYPPAILLSTIGIATLLVLRSPWPLIRGALVTLLMLVMAALINRLTKISLHTMFAFYCATILCGVGLVTGSIALCLAVAVLWSRLYLRRHHLRDVLLGAAMGSIGGVIAAWWP